MTSSFWRSRFEIVPAFSISCKSSHRQYSFVESNTATSLPCPEMYLSPETYSSSYRYTRWFPYFVFVFSTSFGCTSSLFRPPWTLTFNWGFLSSVSFSHFSVSCISNYHFDYIFFSSYILPWMCIQYNHDCRLFLVCTYFGLPRDNGFTFRQDFGTCCCFTFYLHTLLL